MQVISKLSIGMFPNRVIASGSSPIPENIEIFGLLLTVTAVEIIAKSFVVWDHHPHIPKAK